MINNIDDKNNIALYTALLKKHGNSFKTLNWGSKESQELRFKVLAEIGLSPSNSVLDVGCGLGDFYQWLEANIASIDYSGIDITPGMIETASLRYPNTSFLEGTMADAVSESQKFDFVMASGIFAHRKQHPVDFLYKTISQMYGKARKGVAFNCLSDWREEKDRDEFYADPAQTLNYCRSLSKRVVLRHDYHAGDFTVYLYRPDDC